MGYLTDFIEEIENETFLIGEHNDDLKDLIEEHSFWESNTAIQFNSSRILNKSYCLIEKVTEKKSVTKETQTENYENGEMQQRVKTPRENLAIFNEQVENSARNEYVTQEIQTEKPNNVERQQHGKETLTENCEKEIGTVLRFALERLTTGTLALNKWAIENKLIRKETDRGEKTETANHENAKNQEIRETRTENHENVETQTENQAIKETQTVNHENAETQTENQEIRETQTANHENAETQTENQEQYVETQTENHEQYVETQTENQEQMKANSVENESLPSTVKNSSGTTNAYESTVSENDNTVSQLESSTSTITNSTGTSNESDAISQEIINSRVNIISMEKKLEKEEEMMNQMRLKLTEITVKETIKRFEDLL